VTLSADVFQRHATSLFATAPITSLHLQGGYADIHAILACPNLRLLRVVRLSGSWDGNRLARRLVKCPDLGAIRELDLSGCRLTDSGALNLVRASALGKLSVLRVRQNRLTDYGIDLLASAPSLAAVTQLDVTGNPGVQRWAASAGIQYKSRLLF
jgi:hypothetical protein